MCCKRHELSIKEEPALTPLQAEEIWSDTGSQHAFDTLQQYTDALPVSKKDDGQLIH